LQLVSHAPYRGVELTPAGEKVALEVVRHHRLIETYLAEVLGLDWDKVHDEAERLEHVLSEEVEARMAEALGHPTHDPHGAPIPALDGTIQMATDAEVPLSEIEVGTKARVRRVSDENAELLRHLRELSLTPGALVQIERATPEEGVLHLLIIEQNSRCILGISPASHVRVQIENS
jgi:DtxR family Mn-dependent transcriptional regulator